MWTARTGATTAAAATAAGAMMLAASVGLVGVSRGWLIAAWIVAVLTFCGGLLYGRFGKPEGYLLAGVAATIGLIITQPTWSS
jgi:hypothetical protein